MPEPIWSWTTRLPAVSSPIYHLSSVHSRATLCFLARKLEIRGSNLSRDMGLYQRFAVSALTLRGADHPPSKVQVWHLQARFTETETRGPGSYWNVSACRRSEDTKSIIQRTGNAGVSAFRCTAHPANQRTVDASVHCM